MAAFLLTGVHGSNEGARVWLGPGAPRARVGAAPEMDLVLDDAMASRHHASFEIVGDALRVRDEGSGNGTYVNGDKLREAFLVGGERVLVGSNILTVRIARG